MKVKRRSKPALMRAVHYCLIHNTLLSPPEILIKLTTSENGHPTCLSA